MSKHLREYRILRNFGTPIGISASVFAKEITERFSELKPITTDCFLFDFDWFLGKYTRLVPRDIIRIPQLGEWAEIKVHDVSYLYYWNITPPHIPMMLWKLIIVDNFGYILDENFKLE